MTDISVNASTPVNVSQFAGQNLPYIIDVGNAAVTGWNAGASIAATSIIRPTNTNQTGFLYQSGASAGQTGALEPAWPKTAGGTVIDGSVTWTAVAPPAAGEDSIASATWTQANPPDGLLTITGQATGSLVASAFLGQGTSGNVYTVNAVITMHSGAIFRVTIILSIE
jgi:hypothetical protein